MELFRYEIHFSLEVSFISQITQIIQVFILNYKYHVIIIIINKYFTKSKNYSSQTLYNVNKFQRIKST